MAQFWLPPLNSHDQFTIEVIASQSEEPFESDEYDEPTYEIKTSTSVIYSSDNHKNGAVLRGLSNEVVICFGCHQITSRPSSVNTIDDLLATAEVPFELDTKVIWSAQYPDGSIDVPRPLSNQEDLVVEKIREFAYNMKEQLIYNRMNNVLPLNLSITKEIVVPESEFNQWIAYYDEKIEADEDFVREYEAAISRPRTVDELLYHETGFSGFRGATESSIQGLKKFKVGYRDGEVTTTCRESSCSICFDEFDIGSEVVQLHCTHVFHESCGMRWLRESPLCPLCRFPTST